VSLPILFVLFAASVRHGQRASSFVDPDSVCLDSGLRVDGCNTQRFYRDVGHIVNVALTLLLPDPVFIGQRRSVEVIAFFTRSIHTV
jgi:hypothetical protein